MTSVAGVVKVYWKGWGEYTLELRKHMSNSKEAVNEAVDRYNKGIFLLFIYLRARNQLTKISDDINEGILGIRAIVPGIGQHEKNKAFFLLFEVLYITFVKLLMTFIHKLNIFNKNI